MEINDILNDDSILHKAQAALCTDRRIKNSDVVVVLFMVSECRERNEDSGVFTAAGIAKDMAMSRSTVTSIFDRLEKYGYITAEREEIHGRSCRSKVQFSIAGSAAAALRR